jgi:hypothetical protein
MTNEILYFPRASPIFLGHNGKPEEHVAVRGLGFATVDGTEVLR